MAALHNLLSSRDPSVSTAQRSVEALANLVESPAESLWLLDDHGKYVQEARWNFPRVQVAEPAEGGFAGFHASNGLGSESRRVCRRALALPELTVPRWIDELPSAWLVIRSLCRTT